MSETGDWGAELDQALAGARDAARLAATYYAELVKGGVCAEHAAALTATWIDHLRRGDEG